MRVAAKKCIDGVEERQMHNLSHQLLEMLITTREPEMNVTFWHVRVKFQRYRHLATRINSYSVFNVVLSMLPNGRHLNRLFSHPNQALSSAADLDFEYSLASVHRDRAPASVVKLEFVKRCSQHLAACKQLHS